VARLTWWEFSWDIMEPVTYILTFSTAVIGFVYFVVTQSDYTYESLWNKWAHRRRAKLIRRTKVLFLLFKKSIVTSVPS
jgi:hypothetical protein